MSTNDSKDIEHGVSPKKSSKTKLKASSSPGSVSPTQEANSPDQNSTKKKNRTKPAKGETNGRVSISAGDSGKPAKQKKFNKSESQDSNEQLGTPKIRTRPSHQTNTSEDDVPRGKSAGELSRTKQSIESEGDEVPKKSSSMKTTGSKSGQLSVSSTSSGNTTSFKKKSNSKKVPKKQSKEQLGDSREDEENKSSPKSDNSGSNGVINKKKSKLNISSSKDKDKDYDNNNNNNNTHRDNNNNKDNHKDNHTKDKDKDNHTKDTKDKDKHASATTKHKENDKDHHTPNQKDKLKQDKKSNLKESSNNNNDRNSPQKYSNNLDQDDDDDGESSPKKRKSPTKSSTKDNIQRSSSASKVGKMGKPDYSPTKLRKNVKKESEENEGEPEEDNIISTRKGKLATSSPAILHQEATKGSPSSSNLPQSSSFFQRFGLTKKPSVRVTNPKDPNFEPRHVVASCVEELPEDLKEKIKKLGMDENKMNQNWTTVLCILHQVTKDSFREKEDVPLPKNSAKFAQIPDEMLNEAKKSIQVAEKEKELKKLYKRIEASGKGGFGRVFCAKDTSDRQIVAVKKLPHTSQREIRNNLCEVFCLMTLKHANVVKFKDSWICGDEMWIVTEFMEGGTLSQAIKMHVFDERHIRYISREILRGLKFLHENKYVHRDLKSNNVMMSVTGNIKLIDFGLCCYVGDDKLDRVQTLGTANWMPPEIISRKAHGIPADLWSFGIVVLEMYLREPPFSSSRLLCMFKACSGEMLTCINSRRVNVCNDGKNFLEQVLVVDPEKRSSAEKLLQHPYTTGNNLEKDIDSVLKTIFVSNTLAKSGI